MPLATALLPVHEALGAMIVPFAGWSMPLRYTSDVAEHHAVRTAAGMFDLSHMGQLEVSGPDAAALLDRSLVGVYSAMEVGKAKYSMITNAQGRVLDDLIVYRLAESEYLVIANGANRIRVQEALTVRSEGLAAQVVDHTTSRVMIAVQGPAAAGIVAALTPQDLSTLRYYSITRATVAGIPALVARTGYTGEDGFEVIVGAASGVSLWEEFTRAGAGAGMVPAGLAARDTLRLEAGMPLYGHELTEDLTPFEAGLGRVVNLDHDFVGRDALAQTAGRPLERTLVGLAGEGRRAARAGSPVLAGGAEVGQITSGVLSPTLGHPIALAYVRPELAAAGTGLQADVRGKLLPMTVVPLPFYKRKP